VHLSNVVKLLAAAACVAGVAITLPGAKSSSAAVTPRTAPYTYGINTYVTWDCEVSAAEIDQWATTEATEYKDMGATWMAIGFPLYTPSITSDSVYARCILGNKNYQSPSATILGGIVEAVHAVGLKVLLRPLISQTNLYPTNWRGVISPKHPAAWFINYRAALRPYLIMAQAEKVESFSIMTELDKIATSSEWNVVRARARLYYKVGDLVWDYSWRWATRKVRRAGTTFAMDAYPALPALHNNASPSQIAAAWGRLLSQPLYSVPDLSDTTIDEVDIPAQDGAYANSGDFMLPRSTHPFNQAIQANWMAGACIFMKQHHMKGIFFWGPFLTTRRGELLSLPDPGESTNLQPRSQEQIKKCFG
jgi:hypothetical protein